MKPHSLTYYERGLANDMSSDHEEAISDFSRAIELDPKDAATYNNRGIDNE